LKFLIFEDAIRSNPHEELDELLNFRKL